MGKCWGWGCGPSPWVWVTDTEPESKQSWQMPLAHPSAQAGSARATCPGPRARGSWVSPGTETAQPLQTTCASARSRSQQQHLFYVQMRFDVVQFVPIAFGPVTGHHWVEPGSFFSFPPIRLFIEIDKTPLSQTRPSLPHALQALINLPSVLWPLPSPPRDGCLCRCTYRQKIQGFFKRPLAQPLPE